jgi:hypothetical protein
MSGDAAMSSADHGGAPVSQAGRRGVGVVVLVGLATTVLALLGVWWLDNHTDDFHVMGWYGDYVIPAGALLVGLVAGSGYGIASYLTGFRIRRGLLLIVVGLQVAGYFGAQYLEFRSLTREGPLVDEQGDTLTFPTFYHLRAMNFAWDNHGHPGKPLGGWGYFFLGLGVLGFALGGMLAPAVLMKVPYCESCELYMKTRTLALVPASVRARRIAKKDVAGRAAFEEEDARAASAAGATLERVASLAGRGDGLAIKDALAHHPPRGPEARSADRLPARLRLGLVRCRRCSSGFVQPAMITGKGRGIRVQRLARLPLSPDAVRTIAES